MFQQEQKTWGETSVEILELRVGIRIYHDFHPLWPFF
jgi:hypothetical protein